MNVICPISGVSYQVSLPGNGFTKHPHPMLSEVLTATKLSELYLEQWAKGKLSQEETHLLGIALLMKLPLEGVPSLPKSSASNFHAFWEKYLDRLAKLAIKLDGKETKLLPKIRVTAETLQHLPHWIDTLHTEVSLLFSPISEEAKKRNKASYNSFLVSSASSIDVDSLILRGLKGSPLKGKEAKEFPQLIAQWACSVGEFPTAFVTLESGKKLRIDSHWKDIISRAFSKDSIYEILEGDITQADVEELLEYCYEEIPVGSIHASVLFKKLEGIAEILEEFRGGGSKPAPKIEKYKGTDEELLAALDFDTLATGEAGAVQRNTLSTSTSTSNSSTSNPNLTVAQKLAIKLGKASKPKAEDL